MMTILALAAVVIIVLTCGLQALFFAISAAITVLGWLAALTVGAYYFATDPGFRRDLRSNLQKRG